ncbi:MAG: flagellar biosynthetic protein FliO [Alphaproteobacteria bacterium]
MDFTTIARFVLALFVVLGLIGVAAWLLRRFGAGILGRGQSFGRARRLGVVEQTSLDARNRLFLVRRDDAEHLILVGPGQSCVVESSIRRSATDIAAAGPEGSPQ